VKIVSIIISDYHGYLYIQAKLLEQEPVGTSGIIQIILAAVHYILPE
jgi:hypothetical protein